MENEGPPLESLLRRLEDMPPEFLENPAITDEERLHVGALISDLFRKIGILLSTEKLQRYDTVESPEEGNLSKLRSLACWFLQDDYLIKLITEDSLFKIIDETIPSLANEYRASRYIEDAERREEFTRRILSDFNLRPAGETLHQAEDRLQSLDSVERKRIIAASRESEKRAREIRETLAKEAARRAADKYTRD